jgi:thiol-disulfide isomerase/thioredoxin
MRIPLLVILLSLLLFRGSGCLASTKVVYAEAADIKKAIAADKGHVVLVNFWATWCAPCVAEYPSLIELDTKYRSKGLDIIAVSLDLKEDIDGKVKPFVLKQRAVFPQYVLDADDPDAAINAFDKSWQGDIPRTFIYSRSGKLISVLPYQKNYAQFNKAVQGALASH